MEMKHILNSPVVRGHPQNNALSVDKPNSIEIQSRHIDCNKRTQYHQKTFVKTGEISLNCGRHLHSDRLCNVNTVIFVPSQTWVLRVFRGYIFVGVEGLV